MKEAERLEKIKARLEAPQHACWRQRLADGQHIRRLIGLVEGQAKRSSS